VNQSSIKVTNDEQGEQSSSVNDIDLVRFLTMKKVVKGLIDFSLMFESNTINIFEYLIWNTTL
jgi:hypothetical protein